MNLSAVILAAGQGTRMKSKLPKVLHPVAGKAMVQYALDAVSEMGCAQTVLVVGHGADAVRQTVGARATFVEQAEQRGTGHAVLQARDTLRGQSDAVIVTYADMPLLQAATLKKLSALHASSRATITMLTVRSNDSMAFGRIVRDAAGQMQGIVEESDATPEQFAITELNCGVYCFESAWLWEHVAQLKPQGKKAEYYLTDLVARAVAERCVIETIVLNDVSEVIGVNTRVQLAQAERMMRARINTALMLNGVTLIDPAATYIEADVTIGMDTIIEPNTQLRGATRIGENCRIGPNAIIQDTQIGDDCEIVASVLRQAVVEDHVHIGPFADMRPGAYLEHHVYIGNFGEVKNSRVGTGTHIGHFSYIGDATLGAHVNIGAGTVTCNYDGKRKHHTEIGAHAFIGSDTMLRAPVTIGARARTGAGSVVTRNVPDDSLAVGVPARVIKPHEK